MITRIFNIKNLNEGVISLLAQDLKDGAVAVIPTETVYGIVARADNEDAVKKLCAAKNKPLNVPLQYLAADTKSAARLTVMNTQDKKLAAALWPGELTLILTPSEEGRAYLRGFETLGIRVPRHELTSKILNAVGCTLAASSANMHGSADITDEREIVSAFSGKVDYILTGAEFKGTASTVLQTEPFKILREAAISEKEILQILK